MYCIIATQPSRYLARTTSCKLLLLLLPRRVGQYKEGEKIGTPQELANRIFTTVYMGTVNSGSATKDRARKLAEQIGADHLDVKVDIVIDAMAKLFEMITGKTPRFRVRLSYICCCPVEVWDTA